MESDWPSVVASHVRAGGAVPAVASQVQTTFFDGVTEEEHGAELRNRCKQLNAMIDSLVKTQKFQ